MQTGERASTPHALLGLRCDSGGWPAQLYGNPSGSSLASAPRVRDEVRFFAEEEQDLQADVFRSMDSAGKSDAASFGFRTIKTGLQLSGHQVCEKCLSNGATVTASTGVRGHDHDALVMRARLTSKLYRVGLRNKSPERLMALRTREFLDALAAVVDESSADELVRTWGTHFPVEATFGGTVDMYGAVDSTKSTHSDPTVSLNTQVHLNSLSQLRWSHHTRSSPSDTWNQLTSGRTLDIDVQGGDQSFAAWITDGYFAYWDDWRESLYTESPVQLSGVSLPLSALAQDSPGRADLIDLAIDRHLEQADGTVARRPDFIPMGLCDCKIYKTSCQCPDNTVLTGTHVDSYNAPWWNIVRCCTPCDASTPHIGLSGYGSQATPGRRRAEAGERREKLGAAAGTSPSSSRAALEDTSAPLVPGLDRLGLGFNFLTGDFTTASVWSPTAMLDNLRVSEYTHKWSDTLQVSRSYSVPAEVEVPAFSGGIHKDVQVVRSHQEYSNTKAKNKLRNWAASGLTTFFSGGMLGAKLNQTRSVYEASRHVQVLATYTNEMLRTAIDPSTMTLSPAFVAAVQQLDTTDERRMGAMLAEYGTHFVTTAHMGTKLEAEYIIDQQTYGRTADNSISLTTGVSEDMDGQIGLGVSNSNSRKAVRDAGVGSLAMKGGDPSVVGPFCFGSAYQSEVQSMFDRPALADVDGTPIWEAIARVDAAKATAVKSFINAQVQDFQIAPTVSKATVSVSRPQTMPFYAQSCTTEEQTVVGWPKWKYSLVKDKSYANGPPVCSTIGWGDGVALAAAGPAEEPIQEKATPTRNTTNPSHPRRLESGSCSIYNTFGDPISSQTELDVDVSGFLDDLQSVGLVAEETLPTGRGPVVRATSTASDWTKAPANSCADAGKINACCPYGQATAGFSDTFNDGDWKTPLVCVWYGFRLPRD